MKRLEEQLAFYQSYHRTLGCRATHFFGVPLVTFSILIPMGWAAFPFFGHRLSLAMVFVAAVLAYYFLLDRVLAAIMTAVMIPAVWSAAWVSALPTPKSWAVFLASFIGGWVLQILGHVIEGRKPALLDNFAAVLTAPLFLVVEGLSALGFRKYP